MPDLSELPVHNRPAAAPKQSWHYFLLQGQAPPPPLHLVQLPTWPRLRCTFGKALGTDATTKGSSCGGNLALAVGKVRQPSGMAAAAAGSLAALASSGLAHWKTAAAYIEEGSAAAVAAILCPRPVSQVLLGSSTGHTAVQAQQGHGALSQAAERQASYRQASGRSTPGAVVQDGGGSSSVPAMPVPKRRRV